MSNTKIRGFKATSNFPGYESCRIITIDHAGRVWGEVITQNKLFVNRLFTKGRVFKSKSFNNK